MIPEAEDVRTVGDDLLTHFSELSDTSWDVRAHHLEWTCWETVAHIVSSLGCYAMQISGRTPPQGWIELAETPPQRPDGPELIIYPDRTTGTHGMVSCLDAAAGLLSAVVAVTPASRRGFHPYGISDASGFAAMGILEAVVHGHDVLAAHAIAYRPDDIPIVRVLDRLFPDTPRTANPWQDLLRATGRTSESRGRPWHWDSSVRKP